MKPKPQKEKLFSLGAICSIIAAVFLIPFFVWSNIFWSREAHAAGADSSVVNIHNRIIYLTLMYIALAITNFFSIVKSSSINYKQNHIWRGLIFSVSSLIGAQFYYAELHDKLYRETDHSKDKWYEKNKPLYGALAIIIFILAIIGILWYGQKITGQSIF